VKRHEAFAGILAVRSDLSPADERALDAHLGACPDCRRLADEYALQDAFLRRLQLPAPPETLREGVFAKVERRGVAGSWPMRRWVLRCAPVAAMSLAVAALATWPGPSGGNALLRRAAAPTLRLGHLVAPTPAPRDFSAQSTSQFGPRAPTSPEPINGGLLATGISHGLRVWLVVPRRVYPRDALAQVTVRLQNVSPRDVLLAGAESGIAVENVDAEGRVACPCVSGKLSHARPPLPALRLRPGQSVARTTYVALRAPFLQASISLQQPSRIVQSPRVGLIVVPGS
jgi:hypothetical protein